MDLVVNMFHISMRPGLVVNDISGRCARGRKKLQFIYLRGRCWRVDLPCRIRSGCYLEGSQVWGFAVWHCVFETRQQWISCASTNFRPNLGNEGSQATFQLVWLTDAQVHDLLSISDKILKSKIILQGLLSYTMINYDRLGYDAADLNGNNRIGRCQVRIERLLYLF